ncbi:MAG: InlB B-repeat-containing protein [Gaiellaceae bacterium]
MRLPHPASYYLNDATPAFRLTGDLLSVFATNEKTIVYYDGPIGESDVCGESSTQGNGGGASGASYVYLQSGCGLSPPGGGASAEVAAHELLHNLGAVPSQAPHTCPASPAHVCDSPTDVLYPYLTTGSSLDDVVLDFGHDDYYAHSGNWLDLQDSVWLERLPLLPLTVAVSGSGTIAGVANGAVLPCATGCTALPLDNGASVGLSALPAPGFVFSGWSGSCSGTSTSCTVPMTQAASATATFAAAPRAIEVSISGRGTVKSVPAGVSCPGACGHGFLAGTSVALRATPAKGWKLSRWSGSCGGHRGCTVLADRARAVHALFVRR